MNGRRESIKLQTLTRTTRASRRAQVLLAIVVLVCASCGGNEGAGGASSNASATEPAGNTGNVSADIARLEEQAEKNPGDEETRDALSQAYVRRADAARAENRLADALKDYQLALRANPDNAAAQQRAAEVTQQTGGAEATGEYGEPAPLPITPNVTTGDSGSTEGDTKNDIGIITQPSPAASPTPKNQQQQRKP